MADAETNNLRSRSLCVMYLLGKIRRRRRTLETAVTHAVKKKALVKHFSFSVVADANSAK